MKVLVTGSTSFVGRHVVEALLGNNHIVIASGRDRQCPSSFQKRVIWRPMDIETPAGDAFAYFEQPDALIHLAWIGLPNYTSEFHLEQVSSHVNFINPMIENGLSHISGIGTCLEYGMHSGCLKENLEPASPILAYAAGKNSVREIIAKSCQNNGVCFQWLRLFYIVGEGQHSDSLFSQLNLALDAGNKSFPMSEGRQVRDFLDVETAAKMVVQIASQKSIVGTINCCSGKPRTVLEFVKSIVAQRKSNIKLETGAFAYPTYEPMEYWGDTTKQLLALKE